MVVMGTAAPCGVPSTRGQNRRAVVHSALRITVPWLAPARACENRYPPQMKRRPPGDAADEVVALEGPVGHPADARHEGREGAQQRQEARQQDSRRAVARKEGLGAAEVFGRQQAEPAGEGTRTDGAADRIVAGVAEDRGGAHQYPHQRCVQGPRGVHRRQGPGGEQQRITRQERGHHQAGLGEDDHEHDAVDPGVIQRDDIGQVPVQVQEGIEQEMQ